MNYTEIFPNLNPQEKFLFEKILYYHDKISKRNRNLKFFSYLLKISVFIFAASTTVILGIDKEGFEVIAKNIAIILGACITLISAILGYLNIEQFWMRNITNHLRLNKLRDDFIFYYNSKSGLTDEIIKSIYDDLNLITQHNVQYWENLISEQDKN
jgi:hypothetical protein